MAQRRAPLRIAHVTSSISRIGAGVSKVVRDLAEAQSGNNDTINIITLLDRFTQIDQPSQKNITVSACPVTFAPRFGYSRSLQRTLSDQADAVDIYHMHGLWMYPNWAAGNVARKSAIPYIMSPHGMLEPWSLDRRKWKKKVPGLLFEYKNLTRAHCLHACSEQEYQNFRHFGYKGPIARVPLGLTRDEFNIASFATSGLMVDLPQPRLFADKKYLLFLSRLHVKKGLEFLLDAWKSVGNDFPDWHLVIAGGGEPAYVAELQKKAHDAGVADSVTFTGPVHGDNKWGLLKKAGIFILPSYSENFGLVVIEALACGVPVITTKGAPWSDLVTEGCGWGVDVGAQPLVECLKKTLSLPGERLTAMGNNGRLLVESKYVMNVMARKMREVYAWMAIGGPPPDCIKFD